MSRDLERIPFIIKEDKKELEWKLSAGFSWLYLVVVPGHCSLPDRNNEEGQLERQVLYSG
jgi:hypothetical protein